MLQWPNAHSGNLVSRFNEKNIHFYHFILSKQHNQCVKITGLLESLTNASSTCTSSSNVFKIFNESRDNEIIRALQRCSSDDGEQMQFPERELIAFYMGQRMAELLVHYNDFEVELVTESEQLTFADIIAYFGGIMGLFFGASMMAFADIFMFAVDLVVIAFANMCSSGGGKKKKIDLENQPPHPRPINRAMYPPSPKSNSVFPVTP